MEGLKGLDRLQRTLTAIGDKASRKAAKAGVNAGLTPLVRAMRSAVNATGASPELKRAARQSLGKRVMKKEGRELSGKAGFGVGKPTKAKKTKAHERSVYGQGGAKLVRGVGISAANIHWPVLGTKERRQKKTGHRTGAMPVLLPDVIRSAVATSGSAVLEAARAKITKVLAAEAAKLRKG